MPAPSISTCLWFDDQAEAAARLYVSLFDDSEITEIFYKNGDPAAGAFTVAFSLMGQRYWGLNGGPLRLADRSFRASRQIIPRARPRLLQTDASGRVMQAMMGMIKLDIAGLEAAAAG